MQQPEVDNNNITVLGHSEGTVVSHKVAIDNPDKVKNIVLMGALAQNMSEILEFQVVNLPLLYAEQVLDTNHNGLLSVQEASKCKFPAYDWWQSKLNSYTTECGKWYQISKIRI